MESAVTARQISQRGNVLLMVRDRASLAFAMHHFGPIAELVPDAAFLAPVTPATRRDGCVGLLRTDSEQGPARSPGEHWPADVPVRDWLTPGRPETALEHLAAQVRELLGHWPSIAAPIRQALWKQRAPEHVRRG